MHLKNSVSVLVLGLLFFVSAGWVSAQDAADDSSNVIAAWSVKAGALTPDPALSPTGFTRSEQDTVWTAVKKILPPSLLSQVSRFEIFQVPDNPEAEMSTDGYAVLGEDGATFTLGLNADSVRAAFVSRDAQALGEFEPTIVHELGHILSFQPSQMDQTGTVSGTLVIDEGTLKADAYLNRFYNQFWKAQYPNHGPQTSDDKSGAALFAQSPGAFVTEYAATGPLEDFAESFARFVMAPAPAGKAIKDQKVQFFSAWPELTALRSQMRTGLTTKG